jgi:hypothetical protein
MMTQKATLAPLLTLALLSFACQAKQGSPPASGQNVQPLPSASPWENRVFPAPDQDKDEAPASPEKTLDYRLQSMTHERYSANSLVYTIEKETEDFSIEVHQKSIEKVKKKIVVSKSSKADLHKNLTLLFEGRAKLQGTLRLNGEEYNLSAQDDSDSIGDAKTHLYLTNLSEQNFTITAPVIGVKTAKDLFQKIEELIDQEMNAPPASEPVSN